MTTWTLDGTLNIFHEPPKMADVISDSDLEIITNASNDLYGIDRLEFYINDFLQYTDKLAPYNFNWVDPAFFKNIVKAIAFNTNGGSVVRELAVWKFF